jgi:hypothetical protein
MVQFAAAATYASALTACMGDFVFIKISISTGSVKWCHSRSVFESAGLPILDETMPRLQAPLAPKPWITPG